MATQKGAPRFSRFRSNLVKNGPKKGFPRLKEKRETRKKNTAYRRGLLVKKGAQGRGGTMFGREPLGQCEKTP